MTPLIFTLAGPGTEYRIDPVSLRAAAVDPVAMHQIASELVHSSGGDEIEALAASHKSIAAFMLATAGAAAWAERLLRDALKVQSSGPVRPRVVSQLRFVQVLQELDRPIEALEMAESALAAVRSTSELLDLEDFALHHLGKALLQAGERERAAQALSAALQLRKQKGDKLLLQSTEMALSSALKEGPLKS